MFEAKQIQPNNHVTVFLQLVTVTVSSGTRGACRWEELEALLASQEKIHGMKYKQIVENNGHSTGQKTKDWLGFWKYTLNYIIILNYNIFVLLSSFERVGERLHWGMAQANMWHLLVTDMITNREVLLLSHARDHRIHFQLPNQQLIFTRILRAHQRNIIFTILTNSQKFFTSDDYMSHSMNTSRWLNPCNDFIISAKLQCFSGCLTARRSARKVIMTTDILTPLKEPSESRQAEKKSIYSGHSRIISTQRVLLHTGTPFFISHRENQWLKLSFPHSTTEQWTRPQGLLLIKHTNKFKKS